MIGAQTLIGEILKNNNMEVTSFEQSKALLDAGLKRESCDLWWIERWVNEWVGNDEEGNNRAHDEKPVTYLSFVNDRMYNTSGDKIIATPAWSLGRLLRMFESKCGSFQLMKGGYDDDGMKTDKWFASYIEDSDAYVKSDESMVGAVVKLILKLKQEGIEI